MAITTQERYSSIVDAKLRYTLVQRNGYVWNNKYEGNPKAGAVKVPVRDTEATVGDYSKYSANALNAANGAFITVTVDKDKFVNELIDGFEAAAVPDNILADRLDSAGYSLAVQMNADGTKELLSAGTSKTLASVSKSNIYSALVAARTSMSKAKVPAAGRFALVNPDTMGYILESSEFIAASNLGDEVKQSGAIGSIAGFLIFEDASLPDNANVICGHPNWCCRVEEWAVEPKLTDLSNSGSYIGASAVQGRKVYAHKVTKGETVQILTTVKKPSVSITSHSATVTKGDATDSAEYRLNGGAWVAYSSAVATSAGDVIEVREKAADGVYGEIASAKDE